MSFSKTFFASVVLVLISSLVAGYNKLPMHYRLFLHYFLATGNSVNEQFFKEDEIRTIQRLCKEDQMKVNQELSFVYVSEEKHLVNTYDMKDSVQFSFGTFTCKEGYALDTYDFWYANGWAELRIPPRSDLRSDLEWCFKNAASALGHGGEGDVGVGRCLVIKGYGKPFEIKIKLN